MPGELVYAAHTMDSGSATAAAVPPPGLAGAADGENMNTAADETGATQGLADLQMGAPAEAELARNMAELEAVVVDDDESTRAAAAAAAGEVVDRVHQEMATFHLENEILQYSAWTAAGASARDAAARYPTDYESLARYLQKLAYAPSSDDPWLMLGLALMEGPEPTTLVITDRKRTAMYLCSLASYPTWKAEEVTQAKLLSEKFEHAAEHCAEVLPSAIVQRRRIRAPQLPLHKELGATAYQLVQAALPGGRLGTQWSDLLGSAVQAPADIEAARQLAALAEKGERRCGRWLEGCLWPSGPRRTPQPLGGC